MRIHSQLTHRSRSLEVTLTPMIDVVFLLLVFFVWTSSFEIPERLLPTNLLTRGGTQASEQIAPELRDLERVVVRIYWGSDGAAWIVNDVPVAGFAEVRDRLAAVAAIRSDLPVLIDPQDEVPLRLVIQTYDAARQLGFERVQFAAGDPLAGNQP